MLKHRYANTEVKVTHSTLNKRYDEEIANNVDARLMRMFKDAMAFRSGAKSIKEKQVPKNVPKFTKPGVASGDRPSLQKAREVKQQKDQIRKSGGSVDSIAAAITNRM